MKSPRPLPLSRREREHLRRSKDLVGFAPAAEIAARTAGPAATILLNAAIRQSLRQTPGPCPCRITPAHVAAVVPFCRWRPFFWLSPLVIGSMSPDFMYFIFPPPSLRHVGHTSWGLVLFCIPAGLAVLYAFHRFFKRPLVLLLPHAGPGEALAALRTVSASTPATPGLDLGAHFPGSGDARCVGWLYARIRLGPVRITRKCRRS